MENKPIHVKKKQTLRGELSDATNRVSNLRKYAKIPETITDNLVKRISRLEKLTLDTNQILKSYLEILRSYYVLFTDQVKVLNAHNDLLEELSEERAQNKNLN
jgi:hypothetical protein